MAGRAVRWIGGALAVAVAALASSTVQAQRLTPAEAARRCERLKQVAAIPARDLPNGNERASLATCVSEDLYYGFDGQPDYVKARYCAFLDRELETREDPFAGPGILMMIYANGQGVARNFDLAQRFACEIDGAEAELEGRLAHLARLAEERWTWQNFDVCDDTTSGLMMGLCEQRRERFAEVARARTFDAYAGTLTPPERKALDALVAAKQAFATAHAEHETDLGGTARTALMIIEQAKVDDGFAAALARFSAGNLPAGTPGDASRADAGLNRLYRRIQSDVRFSHGTVTRGGVNRAQKAWLAYRDAWLAYGRLKYPAVPAAAWVAWLTGERAAMLKALVS